MKYVNRMQKRHVNETMASLLAPLKQHTDQFTTQCIEITLRILQETEIEEEKQEQS